VTDEILVIDGLVWTDTLLLLYYVTDWLALNLIVNISVLNDFLIIYISLQLIVIDVIFGLFIKS